MMRKRQDDTESQTIISLIPEISAFDAALQLPKPFEILRNLQETEVEQEENPPRCFPEKHDCKIYLHHSEKTRKKYISHRAWKNLESHLQ
ncbi:hypothetical protein AVEN_271201-1 [Araneus ventricosus]|uniref:Uncharacterized protein n=1 Tax=Araneus ventricosus TaxID=182803 RepID=A0A4Y2S9F4_ARAVE|nr:hypothetical protein AVEN_271201-1 [Araneus ventricosus]